METTESSSQPSAMSVGLKFGVILGLLSITSNLISTVIGYNPLDRNWVIMVVASLLTTTVVVFAHNNFKGDNNGFMSYGQGLGIAMVLVLTSIILNGVYTFVYIKLIDPALMESIWEKAALDMEEKGQSEEQIEFGLGIAKKLFWVFYIIGGSFWGLIIGLIVSIFTQNKEPEQAF